MKSYHNLYEKVISLDNLFAAYKKARIGKTKKVYVLAFEEDLSENLMQLHHELKDGSYAPLPLEMFILRDPKTRMISKSNFRDRIVHHALHIILEPIFDRTFIYDSCANRKGKGNIFAIKRFDIFKRKVSKNGKILPNRFKENNHIVGYCLKADIRHYFATVDQKILLSLIKRKVSDVQVINLIEKILYNFDAKEKGKGMPLGNLTSQFFANIYLNELDYYVKHVLRIPYYIRYVDDFVILNAVKEQLVFWKEKIDCFLRETLLLELHPEKSKIISLARGVDFVGFRNFYYFRLPRKRNVKNMERKVVLYSKKEFADDEITKIFQGWRAYVAWSQSYHVRKRVAAEIYRVRGLQQNTNIL
ncbi:MAG TPA: reverse transcriptase domain-containing protein [Candidatus Nanoarchaeia archaeon]|nr:reverse transcriptase domain-containing protein [Candidatus Nanoarchaeia archaeon]